MVEVWKQLICQSCGSNAVEIVDGLLCCKVCKSKHTLQEKISEEEVITLNVAAMDRNAYKFEDALEKYEQLLQKYPDNEMANWGALLADYGIAYVKDYDEKLVPTCHRLSERPIEVCSYYYKLNDDHKARADEIEKLRIAIMEKANKIQPYDVFICYKATEDVFGRSVPTKEAGWAREIYTMLKHKLNLRVFFAEESLVGENSEWEPHIYKALNTAKLMFVLTTGKQNVNAAWVKNEWKRFSRYIKEGQDKTIRVVYDIMNAYDLPWELRNTQAINHDTMGWGEAVRKAAENIFAPPKPIAPTPAKPVTPTNPVPPVKPTAPAKPVTPTNPVPTVKPAAPDTPKSTGKYCTKCGANNVLSAKFCTKCAHNIFAPKYKQYCIECKTETELLESFCPNCKSKQFVYTEKDYKKEQERRKQAEIAREFDIVNGVLKKYKGTAEEVIIPDVVTSIGDSAFENSGSVTSIMMHDNIMSIGEKAFFNCVRLKTIKLSFKATRIGNFAFQSCSSLTRVVMPNSITSIGINAFFNCEKLKEIRIPDRVISIAAGAFSNCSSLTSITIPDSVTSIGDSAFSKCYALANVTMGNSVTSIGDSVFSNCGSLTSITIPDRVTKIGRGLFNDCNNLMSIQVGVKNKKYKGVDGNLYSKDGNVFIQYAIGKNEKSFIIPDGVKSIGNQAFSDCSSLTDITIPDSVTSIGDYAFYGCSSLTSINIPDCVTSIGEDAFRNCSSLTSITIPDSVTSIGRDAFSHCSDLTSISCPAFAISYMQKSKLQTVVITSGESIGERAFYKCDGLTSITIPESVTSIGSLAFCDCSSLANIYITDIAAFCNISGLSNLMLCNTSNKNLYLNNQLVTELGIPDSVTSIGDYAFYSCSSLTSVVIPDSVTSIGDNAFYKCSSLTSVVIGNGVTNIGGSAFWGCENLECVVISDSVTSIGDEAFGCCGLKNVMVGNSVTSIGEMAFRNCSRLTAITIPDSVMNIGNWAFLACEKLKVYARVKKRPEGWNEKRGGFLNLRIEESWNPDNRPVVWGYKGETK